MQARDELRRDPERAAGQEAAVAAPTDRIVDLQRSAGNAAVARLVQRRERPQSTDAPGHGGHGGHAKHAEKALPDVHTRVIGYSIEHDMTKISIAANPDQGVREGVPGYIEGPGGKSYEDFVIADMRGAVAHAFVKAIPDVIRTHDKVVLQPSKAGPRVEDQQF